MHGLFSLCHRKQFEIFSVHTKRLISLKRAMDGRNPPHPRILRHDRGDGSRSGNKHSICSFGGHSCRQPVTSVALCSVIKPLLSEWPFIRTSPRHTCVIILLFNQHLDMLPPIRRMDYLGRDEVLTHRFELIWVEKKPFVWTVFDH